MQQSTPAAIASGAIALGIANVATGGAVVYVTDDASRNVLSLTLTNAGSQPLLLKGGAPVAEGDLGPDGPTSLYFTISRILTAAEFATMIVTPPPGWQSKLIGSWALTPIADVSLPAGGSVVFTLGGITADGSPGPGSCNVDTYNFPGVDDNGEQLPLALQSLPDRHKRLADAVSTTLAGGNAIFIDVGDAHAIPANTLVLRLDNMTQGPLVPPGTPAGSPAFYLSFVSAGAAPGYGALTTIDRLKNVRVGLGDDYGTIWSIQDHSQETPPYWAIYPKSPDILGTGAEALAEFRITGIVTDFAPSSTNLYLQSAGIPGYDDGVVALALDKVVPTLAIQGLFAISNDVPSGSSVDLEWSTFNANRCTIDPVDGGSQPAPTQATAFPVVVARTTTFTLVAYNDALGTRTSAPVTVNVQPVSVVTPLTATPGDSVHFGDPVSLSWAFASAQSCTIDPPIDGSSSVPAVCSGTIVHPTATVRYTITAQGQDGPATTSLTLTPIPAGWQSLAGAGHWDTWGRPVLVPDFLDKLWFYAGGPVSLGAEVFSTRDGFSWDVATNAAAYSPRGDAAGCAFAGKLWLTGGTISGGATLDEIWSSVDGVTWTQVQAGARWSPRSSHGCIAMAGKLWVMGGIDAQGDLLGDVWSSPDGVTWTQVSAAAPWGPRAAFGIALLGESIVLVAGRGANGPVADVWQSADGAAWNGFGRRARWPARSNPNVAVIGDRLYVVGGTDSSGTALDDNNVVDAAGNWSISAGPGWDSTLLNVNSAAFHGAMWFAGGAEGGAANTTVWGFGP